MASSITYEDALNTLDSMFGDPWNQNHLDAVLRHFQGHMENTVEAVLNHGNGAPEELLARLKSSSSNKNDYNRNNNTNQSSADTSMDAEIARKLSAQLQQQDQEHQDSLPSLSSLHPNTNRAAAAVASKMPSSSSYPAASAQSTQQSLKNNGKKWIGTPTDLLPDFLRLPGMSTSHVSDTRTSVNGGNIMDASSDIASDEALARMLQDTLFTEELANNPEFAHLAGSGIGRGPGGVNASRFGGVGFMPPKTNAARNRGNGANGGSMNEGPNIVEKISEMGENAKKKLSLFAAQWNTKMKNKNENSSETYERRGLLDDSPNTDEDGRNVEMKSMGLDWGGSRSQVGKKDD